MANRSVANLYLVSMEEMVARSVRACMPAAEVAQVNLESRVEDSLPKIRIDRRRLSKVFVNLIENAIQHSPQKSSVTIEARPNQRRKSRVGPVRNQGSRQRNSGRGYAQDL